MSSNTISEILGTDADEDFIGTDLWERFYGFGGRDRIYAKGGNDQLYGGVGNDLLDGGAGQDVMYGESGDDSYRVDNPEDIVSEELTSGQDDGGVDTVTSTIGFALGAFIEKLVLSGSGAIDGAGNDLNNNIKGNGSANVLFGGDGSDVMYGYGGDDTLVGGLGRDYLTGGAGPDTFVLRPEAGSWDKIYDLAAEDRIGIYANEFGLSEGAGLTAGVLDPSYFVAGAAATAVGHGQFVFDAADSELLWDADGAGGTNALRITLLDTAAIVTADQIHAFGQNASASVGASGSSEQSEENGLVHFALTLSQPLNEGVIITCSTMNGSATGGEDFVAFSSVDVLIGAGLTTAYVPVEILDDNLAEGTESFSLRLDAARGAATGAPLAIDIAEASVSITDTDSEPSVVMELPTTPLGMTDPSGIAYDPSSDTLFMVDSEVDESPFFQSTNFFGLDRDGGLKSSADLPFTTEPTGLAMDTLNGRLFMTDDDDHKVFSVDPDDPNTVLWEFDTLPLGGNDPEDIAIDAGSDNLFIVNGLDRTIIEVDQGGTQLFDSIVLPSEISDPEALAFDSQENVFYVGGGFSDSIWKVDRDGSVLDVLTVLEGARSQDLNRRVNVKDIELAPASDDSGETHIYVADYGWSHEADGRLIEIDPGDGDWALV